MMFTNGFKVGDIDIICRKIDGQIVPVSGALRLDSMLRMESEVKVTMVDSMKEVVVIRNDEGLIVEKNG